MYISNFKMISDATETSMQRLLKKFKKKTFKNKRAYLGKLNINGQGKQQIKHSGKEKNQNLIFTKSAMRITRKKTIYI